MPYPDSVDLSIDKLGGRCTSIPPSILPPGASPDNAEVSFPQAAVKTREPITSLLQGNAGVAFNGMNNFYSAKTGNVLLTWDNQGNLYQESTPGVLSVIASGGTPGTLMNSTQIFGREYMAFRDGFRAIPSGKIGSGVYGGGGQIVVGGFGLTQLYPGPGGTDFPRQWDGTFYDRVSQEGPAQAPTVVDGGFLPGYPIEASPVGLEQLTTPIVQITQLAGTNLATVELSVTQGANALLEAGDVVPISGNTVAAYNGNVTVLSSTPSGFSFAAPTSGLGTGTGGTADLPLVLVLFAGAMTEQQLAQFVVGQSCQITGAGIAGYNGIWPIRSTPGNAPAGNLIIIITSTGLADSGGGTVAPPSGITAGLRQVSVANITRQGYITKPPPPSNYNALGSQVASVTGIPIGPSNVVARLLLFTTAIVSPETSGDFYSIEGNIVIDGITYSNSMLIADNTTTSVTLNFRDTDLASGFSADYLFTLIELGECAGVTSYRNRTVWWGERSRLRNMLNLTFNGGWSLGGGAFGSDLPLGWTSGGTQGAGGSRVANGGVWLDAYQINAELGQGMIYQSCYQDYLGVPIIRPFTSYSVRVRAKSTAVLPLSVLVVDIYSPSTSGILDIARFPMTNFGTTYSEQILSFNTQLTIVPADAVMRIYAQFESSSEGAITIDSVYPYPTQTPVNVDIAWMSYAFNPESFDATLSQVSVRPTDGQAIRGGFTIRGNLYLGKERYLASTTDDDQNEPSSWDVSEVSDTIGISGPDAVDVGEEWAALGNRAGLYVFWGADPVKISEEIEEDASYTGKLVWNSVNWLVGPSLWVRINTEAKKIFVGIPTNTFPDVIFPVDYKFEVSGESLASAPGVAWSAFTAKLLERGGGRKWSLWNFAANSCCLSERSDSTAKILFGNSAGDGWIYQVTPGATSQDVIAGAPTAIDCFYQTYQQPSIEEEQQLQLGAHRKIADYVSGLARGNGVMGLSATSPIRTTPLRGVTLSESPAGDFERQADVHGERIMWTVGTNGLGDWFQLEKLTPSLKPDPTMPLRGTN